jgi:hypothetical protein
VQGALVERDFRHAGKNQEAPHQLGPKRLFPGKTIRIRFAESGRYLIECLFNRHKVHRQVAAIASRSLSGESPSAVNIQKEFPRRNTNRATFGVDAISPLSRPSVRPGSVEKNRHLIGRALA